MRGYRIAVSLILWLALFQAPRPLDNMICSTGCCLCSDTAAAFVNCSVLSPTEFSYNHPCTHVTGFLARADIQELQFVVDK